MHLVLTLTVALLLPLPRSAAQIITSQNAAVEAQPQPREPHWNTVCDDHQARDITESLIDEASPRYFVEVTEVTPKGDRWHILTARNGVGGAPRVGCERINPEVDRNSKLVIRLNRNYLAKRQFEGSFSISARLESPSGTRPVEVKGYSMIGKASQAVSVGIKEAGAVINMVGGLSADWRAIEPSLRHALQRAEGLARELEANQKAVADSSEKYAVAVLNLRSDSTLAAAAVPTSVTDSIARSALLSRFGDTLRVLRRRAAVYGQLLRSRPTVWQDTLVERTRPILRGKRPAMLALQEIIRPENAAVAAALAGATSQFEYIMVERARTAGANWSAMIQEDTANDESYDALLRELISAMSDLVASWGPPADAIGLQAWKDSLTRKSQERLVLSAKDAEINIETIGANIGEHLVLSLTDSVGNPRTDRTHELRMQIREVGVLRRVADALILVTIDPDGDESEKIAAAQLTSNADGEARALEFPVGTRGSPTAGVSLGWTYAPRREVSRFLNWLEPGAGFVALAASLPMKRVVIARNASPKTELVDPQLTYSLGFLASIFDGSLMGSYGMTLNGGRARDYWGIGVSFLNATEKAREIFQGLAR